MTLLTPAQVAERLQVSVAWVRDHSTRKYPRLPVVRIGGLLRYWEDSDAAHKWRMHQARRLINVSVTYIDDGKHALPMRVFVSLTPDRKEAGGRYRPMVTVLSDADQKRQLLQDALRELKTFEDKYRGLRELTSVFDAIRATRRELAGAPALVGAAA